ncbi:MAG: hypothetical protein MO853_08470 [Candidatus Protistobacter heckmanni]|nr:hypothetical protein [Candidatus Protistobacter heckmanni]
MKAATASLKTWSGTPTTAASVDRRIIQQRLLDFLGVDVEAPGKHHVLLAVDDVEIAVDVEARHVARLDPAVDDGRGGGVWTVVIAAHGGEAAGHAAAHQQFAGLAHGDFDAGLVHELDLHARRRAAHGGGVRELLFVVEAGDRADLGHGEEGMQLDVRQQLDELALELGREGFASDDDVLEAGAARRILLELRHEHARQGGHHAGDGDAFLSDQVEGVLRVEAAHADHGAAQA